MKGAGRTEDRPVRAGGTRPVVRAATVSPGPRRASAGTRPPPGGPDRGAPAHDRDHHPEPHDRLGRHGRPRRRRQQALRPGRRDRPRPRRRQHVAGRRRSSQRSWAPPGPGKSTLLHVLAGLDRPTSGEVYVGDTEITSLEDRPLTLLRRDAIGFIFQSFNLLPTLTAAENIELPMRIAGPHARCALGAVDRRDRRPGGAARPPAVAAVRRAAAARGCRPRARQPAAGRLRRRADRSARLAVGRRAARASCSTAVRTTGPDRRHGDARPGGGRATPIASCSSPTVASSTR